MPKIDIMLPVYNEEKSLAHSVLRLHYHLEHVTDIAAEFNIVIVDNASIDGTQGIGEQLAADHEGIHYLRLPRKGRGYALHTAWSASTADVVAYMDIDLSTSLDHLPDLVNPLLNNEADIAVGSRLSKDSRVAKRTALREILSRGYNFLLKFFMDATFVDAQCGFKAVRREVFAELAPDIKDTEWFFDTELLLKGSYRGYRLREVPVVWIDDPDSRVRIVDTVKKDLLGMKRVYFSEKPHSLFNRLFSFGIIGLATTVLYGGLVFLFQLPLEGWLGKQPALQIANFVALVITTIVNVALNRRFTYRRSGMQDAHKHYAAGFAAFLIFLVVTQGGTALLHNLNPNLTNAALAVYSSLISLIGTLVKYAIFSIGFRENTDKDVEDAVMKTKAVIEDKL